MSTGEDAARSSSLSSSFNSISSTNSICSWSSMVLALVSLTVILGGLGSRC
jgi:hypothetical protein